MLNRLRARARHLARSDGSEGGFTLMEVLVTGVLMAIVMSMALVFFVQFNHSNSALADENISTASARNVLQEWAATIRLADSPVTAGMTNGRIVKITPTEIEFYADLGNRNLCSPSCAPAAKPTEVDLSLNSDGQLVQQYFEYDTATQGYPATPTTSTVVANGVVGVDWLFLPYVQGDPPSAVRPVSCNGAPGLCGDAAQAVLDNVVQIDINFGIAAQADENIQTFTASAALSRGASA